MKQELTKKLGELSNAQQQMEELSAKLKASQAALSHSHKKIAGHDAQLKELRDGHSGALGSKDTEIEDLKKTIEKLKKMSKAKASSSSIDFSSSSGEEDEDAEESKDVAGP